MCLGMKYKKSKNDLSKQFILRFVNTLKEQFCLSLIQQDIEAGRNEMKDSILPCGFNHFDCYYFYSHRSIT